MQAQKKILMEFLRSKHQLRIPIYQRHYNWEEKQCRELWEDIMKISNNYMRHHFIGSIVRIKKDLDNDEISKQVIIDGQQRIASILLLVTALISKFKEYGSKVRAEDLTESYLINRFGQENMKYKLLLTNKDNESFIHIINFRDSEQKLESQIIKNNFDNFCKWIQEELNKNSITSDKEKLDFLEKIFSGIKGLIIVDIVLNEYDDSQLIFESLNSTGLQLSKVDLIRNFILIGLDSEKQKKLYNNYWIKIENNFKDLEINKANEYFKRFIRDYLIVKIKKLINIPDVYFAFKEYFAELDKNNCNTICTNEIVLKDIYKFSKYFHNMLCRKENMISIQEKDKDILKAFLNFKKLNIKVAYPFFLHVYDDYKKNIINKNQILEIICLIESYIFRRCICKILTRALNTIFVNLYKKIDKNNYVITLKKSLSFELMYFPKDEEFKEKLENFNLYKAKTINRFIFFRIENFNRKELINEEGTTIEHIMPQKLNEKWKKDLGPNWEKVHSRYLHTIGNLTFTNYNSEMGSKTFQEKKKLAFNDSPLKLNKSIRIYDVWNEENIVKRTKELFKKMCEIWPYPKI